MGELKCSPFKQKDSTKENTTETQDKILTTSLEE